jgi:acetoin utilization protein AcuB
MLVRDRMSRKLVAARPRDTVAYARELMQRHRFRHLPVVHGRRLVGIVSDRDLRGTRAAVAGVMRRQPRTIAADASVDEAAWLMQTKKINALPVVDGEKLVGMITSADLLAAFIELSGVGEPTTRLTVQLDGRGGERRARQIIHECKAELKWAHRDRQPAPGRLHVRLKQRDVTDVVTALEAAGFEVSTVMAPAASRRRRT